MISVHKNVKCLSFPVTTGIAITLDPAAVNIIQLSIENITYPDEMIFTGNQQESYSLTVDPIYKIIAIKSATEAGLFYGAQTLRSMMWPLGSETASVLPAVHIIDAPRFPHRGLMLDVSRNFFSKEEIFKIIDTLAMYKMNTLHLHLSDDQGWRLEIPALPELTEVSRHGEDIGGFCVC